MPELRQRPAGSTPQPPGTVSTHAVDTHAGDSWHPLRGLNLIVFSGVKTNVHKLISIYIYCRVLVHGYRLLEYSLEYIGC